MAVIKALNSKGPLDGIIKYVTREEKTEERLISGKDCSPSNVLEEMKVTKEIFNKTAGRQYKHFIQSFDPNDNLDYMKANKIGLEWAEKNFKGFEVLISTHKDKGHIHNHFVVNSVSFEDGRKLRYSNKELQNFKNVNDRICEREGLNIVRELSKDITSFNHNKYKVMEKAFKGIGESYFLNTGLEVSNSLKVSKTKEEFIKSMEEKGYKVNWKDTRKYITFTTPEGKKIRNSNLQKTFKKDRFTKEGIENELRYNREKERESNFRKPGISKTPGDKFNAKDGIGEQFVERVLGSITREIAGIEARAKGDPRENKRDTTSDNREDKRIEDKQRTIEREYRGRIRDLGR